MCDSKDIPPEEVFFSCRAGLVLARRWSLSDAPLLKDALDVTWDDMNRWIPGVYSQSEGIDQLEQRLAKFREDFAAGGNALYGLFKVQSKEQTVGPVLGSVGLFRRVGPGALEIGYWIRSDHKRMGLATESSRCMAELAFTQLRGIHRLEIHCQKLHHASSAVAKKLGFRLDHIKTEENGKEISVYHLTKADWEAGLVRARWLRRSLAVCVSWCAATVLWRLASR